MSDAYTLTPRECTELQRKAYDAGVADTLADMDLAAFLLGKREAIREAVQRVEALAFDHENGHGVLIVPTAEVIAAIKGGSDE